MPRPKNPDVAELMEWGFSRRDAFRLSRVRKHPITWQMFGQDRLSLADAEKMVKEYDYEGEQAIIASHLMRGWKFKDAESAFWVAIITGVKEAEALDPSMSDAQMNEYLNAHHLPQHYPGGVYPAPPTKKATNHAKWHDSEPAKATADLADAVAEIQRLRSKLYDLGVDPDA